MHTYDKARIKTRKKIIDAFWSQYKMKQIEKITVKGITNECQIHRATFYLHYQDIYAVLEEIEDMLTDSLEQVSIEYFESAHDLNNFAKALFKIFHDNREYLHYLVIETRHPDFAMKYKNKLKDKLPKIFHPKVIDSKTNIAIDVTLSSLVDMFLQWADKDVFSVEEIISMSKGFMIDGIFQTMLNVYDIEPIINLHSESYNPEK